MNKNREVVANRAGIKALLVTSLIIALTPSVASFSQEQRKPLPNRFLIPQGYVGSQLREAEGYSKVGATKRLTGDDQTKQNLRFSRPTIKGVVVSEPAHFRTVYKDQYYQFAVADKSTGEIESSSFFARDLVRQRWTRVTNVSTENARLGKAFVHNGGDESDFRGLANADYAEIPIKLRGLKLLPDTITFDQNKQLYRFDFNYQLCLSITLSYFWVSKADLETL